MTKLFTTALLFILAAVTVLYAIQPVDAAVPPPDAPTLIAHPIASIDLSMPPPQAPLDTTPITPVETVGAAAFEPF